MQLSKRMMMMAALGVVVLAGATTAVGCYEECQRYKVDGDYMVCADDEGDGDGDGDGDDDDGGKSTGSGKSTSNGGGTTTSGGGTTTSGGGTTTSGGNNFTSCAEACQYAYSGACPGAVGDAATCTNECNAAPAIAQSCFFCHVALCTEDQQTADELCVPACTE